MSWSTTLRAHVRRMLSDFNIYRPSCQPNFSRNAHDDVIFIFFFENRASYESLSNLCIILTKNKYFQNIDVLRGETSYIPFSKL